MPGSNGAADLSSRDAGEVGSERSQGSPASRTDWRSSRASGRSSIARTRPGRGRSPGSRCPSAARRLRMGDEEDGEVEVLGCPDGTSGWPQEDVRGLETGAAERTGHAGGWEAVGLSLKKGNLVAWPIVLLKRPVGWRPTQSCQLAGAERSDRPGPPRLPIDSRRVVGRRQANDGLAIGPGAPDEHCTERLVLPRRR